MTWAQSSVAFRSATPLADAEASAAWIYGGITINKNSWTSLILLKISACPGVLALETLDILLEVTRSLLHNSLPPSIAQSVDLGFRPPSLGYRSSSL